MRGLVLVLVAESFLAVALYCDLRAVHWRTVRRLHAVAHGLL